MYNWLVVSDGFPSGAPFNTTQTAIANGEGFWFENGDVGNDSQPSFIVNMQKTAKSWQNLTATDCLQAYGNDIAPTRKDVVVVSSDVNNTNSLFNYGFAGSEDLNYDGWNSWICSQFDGGGMGCDANAVAAESPWTVGGHPIMYCLSEQTEAICSVNYSLWIGVVVISFNIVKFLAMIFVLVRFDVEKLLTTPGDAMADFLQAEDFTTRGLCLVDRPWMRHNFHKLHNMVPAPMPYNGTRHRFRMWAASRWIWILFTVFLAIGLLFVLFLLFWGSSTLEGRGLGPNSVGFGEPNANALAFDGNTGNAATMAVLANSPQVVISIFAIIYNGLLTSMALAEDFSTFAFKPQHLMVSTPAGKQRGTWLLGLPLFNGVISLALQILLHFFVSQSLFPVQIDIVAEGGTIATATRASNAGYSPPAIYASTATILLLALNVYILGLRRLRKGGPPIVSTCSAAISAACHVPQQIPWEMRGEEMVYGEVRWGATALDAHGVGHCGIVPRKAWDLGMVGSAVPGAFYW